MKPRTSCPSPPSRSPSPSRAPSLSSSRPRLFGLVLALAPAVLGLGVRPTHGQTAPCAAPPCITLTPTPAPAPAPQAAAPTTAQINAPSTAAGPPAAPRATAPAPSPASAAPTAPLPAVSNDPVRRRCRTAGVVLLSLAGATLVGFFGTLIYNAVEHPENLSLDPVPRFVFALSAVSFGITGSVLLAYGRSTPPPPVRPTLSPTPPPPPLPSVLPTAPDAPSGLGAGLSPAVPATLELRF